MLREQLRATATPTTPTLTIRHNEISAACFCSTAGRHHKAADTLADRNVITRLFYGCYPFFAFCCVGTELFYVALYLLVFVPEASFELGAGVAVSLHAVSFFVVVVMLCASYVVSYVPVVFWLLLLMMTMTMMMNDGDDVHALAVCFHGRTAGLGKLTVLTRSAFDIVQARSHPAVCCARSLRDMADLCDYDIFRFVPPSRPVPSRPVPPLHTHTAAAAATAERCRLNLIMRAALEMCRARSFARTLSYRYRYRYRYRLHFDGRAGVLLRIPAGVRVQAGGQRRAAVRGVHVPRVGGVGRSRRRRRNIEEKMKWRAGG